MKKHIKTKLLLLLAITLTISSCKKETIIEEGDTYITGTVVDVYSLYPETINYNLHSENQDWDLSDILGSIDIGTLESNTTVIIEVQVRLKDLINCPIHFNLNLGASIVSSNCIGNQNNPCGLPGNDETIFVCSPSTGIHFPGDEDFSIFQKTGTVLINEHIENARVNFLSNIWANESCSLNGTNEDVQIGLSSLVITVIRP